MALCDGVASIGGAVFHTQLKRKRAQNWRAKKLTMLSLFNLVVLLELVVLYLINAFVVQY